MAGIQQVSFTSPYAADESAIAYRRKLAEMLAKEAIDPLPANRMAGRFVVPTSPWEGAAKIAKGIGSGWAQSQAEERQKEVGERAKNERGQALAEALRKMQGTPESFEDAAGNYAPQPASKPDPMGGLQALARSDDPMLSQAGAAGMVSQMIPKQTMKDLGGSIGVFDQTGKLIGMVPKSTTPDAQLRSTTSLATHAAPSGSALATVQGAAERHAAPSGNALVAERGAMARHGTASGSAVLGASTAARGQDLSAETARRGQDIGVNPALQGPVAQAKAAGKEFGEAGAKATLDLPQAVATAKQGVNLIDQMIGDLNVDDKGKLELRTGGVSPHAGFSVGVGASAQPGAQYISGTDKAGFYALKDQVLGGAFMQAFQSLKGGGQITEVEGTKATSAITRMSTAQSEVEFVKAAREFQDVIKAGLQRAQTRATPQRRASDAPGAVIDFNSLPR